MNSLYSNKLIQSSQIFLDFLTIQDENFFNSKFNEYKKIKIPTNISEYKTIEGELKIKFSHEKENDYNIIKSYAQINEEIMKKIKNAYKRLIIEMKQITITMKEISELYKQLYTLSNKSNDVK